MRRRILSGVVLLAAALAASGQPTNLPVRRVTELDQERAKTLAGHYGWVTRHTYAGGRTIELQSIVNGIPQYYVTHNRNAAISVSTFPCWPGGSSGLDLTGEGVTLGIWDGGAVDVHHVEFDTRATQVDHPADIDEHATHVAGTMIAAGRYDGTPADKAKGGSPAALLRCYDWNSDSSEASSAATQGLRVSNHSYGYAHGFEYFDDWYWYGDVTVSELDDYTFGRYDTRARSWDQLCNSKPYYLPVRSAGNDRTDTGPPPGQPYWYIDPDTGDWTSSTAIRNPDGPWDCIGDVALAKNILTVGAVEDVTNGYHGPTSVHMTTFSSWGPTDDGRIKPDLVGNGYELFSSLPDDTWGSASGTSMSSPNVSGSLGLLIQHWRATHPGQGDMRSSTLKALVLHTADECGSANGPDYSYGWGLLNTLKAAQTISADADPPGLNIHEHNLPNHGQFLMTLTTDGISTQLRVTICWNDPAASVPPETLDPPQKMLVNDLDLRLVSRTGTTFRPWVLDRSNPSAAATTGDNITDNVEQIVISNPGRDTYNLTISHKGSLSGSSQWVSIIITGAATIAIEGDCNSNGVPDSQDIQNGTSQDCNANTVPDECDLILDPTLDCDQNGIIDACELDRDSDGDGVIDPCDGCPNDPLKSDPGQCGCGQVDGDRDDDGVADCLDGCPDDPVKSAPGQCGCGNSDMDTDLDGTADCVDGCPLDPGKTEPGMCGCGVPDDDSDLDGTPDCLDGCPFNPTRTTPGICGCDKAEYDTDGDGTPDCIDWCPDDPLKVDPGRCGCGAADTDVDQDEIPGCLDNCPFTSNFYQLDSDNDGVGDACDNCPFVWNPDQRDRDHDGIGDACDPNLDTAKQTQSPPASPPASDSSGTDESAQSVPDNTSSTDAGGGSTTPQQTTPVVGTGLCGAGAMGWLTLTLLGLSCLRLPRRRDRRHS